ncbi:MAG: glycosyltransferase [Ginsengibacter sp.]
MSIINLHIYPSPFKFESRILRETKSIIEFGLADEVIIASGWDEGFKEWEQIDEKRSVKRFSLFFDRLKKNSLVSILKYFEFIIKVFFFYRRKKIRVVNCHSLFVLPVGYLLKLSGSGIWLIYDAHELESQKTGLNKISKTISSVLEKFLIKRVDRLIVVSPSIGKWYENKYGISNVVVIRNIPELSSDYGRNRVFNDLFRIPENSLIFIYQGVVNKGRGIQLLIDVFKSATAEKHLVVMGYGPFVDIVKCGEKQYPNIHFLEAVPPSEISYYSSGADVGLSIIENVSLSYYYCLPNKLFEYINCDLPVIVSNFPDMKQIVNKFQCGWTTDVSINSLADIISTISREAIVEKKKNVSEARLVLNWENESSLLYKTFPQKNA